MVRLSVNEASEILGISQDGVRKRIQRGTLEAEKEQDGSWTVLLDKDIVRDQEPDRGVSLYIEQIEGLKALNERQNNEISRLYAQIDFLQRELQSRTEEIKRRDTLMMGLQNKLPELPPPRGSIFSRLKKQK